MSAARFFQLISGNGQKRSLEENEEAAYEFVRAPKDIKWEILKTLWKRGQIQEVLAICASKNKEIRRFCKTYTHPTRGGVLGALLEWTNPDLRNKHFPYISYLVLKFPKQPWDYFRMSDNPSVTWEVVLANPNEEWDFNWLAQNPHVTWQMVKSDNRLYFTQRTYHGFSQNPNVTWDVVQSNPNFKWDYVAISRQPNIIWNNIILMAESDASANPNITWDIVQSNPDYPWRMYELSKHKNITWQIIKDNLEFGWDWNGVTVNPNITWKIILDNPTYPWKRDFLFLNSNITPSIVTENKLRWTMEFLSNPNMTLDWALEHEFEILKRYEDENYFSSTASIADKSKIIRSDIASISNVTWDVIRQNMSLFQDVFWSDFSRKQDKNL